jgi:hypothetical protein
LGDPVSYIRYMGLFRIAMMYTKLIRIKWGMFWNILQVAGVHQGQVGGPGELHKVHGIVQDCHDLYQTDQDEVGNVLAHTKGS